MNKSETLPEKELCNSFHEFGGMRCIRAKGHDGRCWCKAGPADPTGAITRGEWKSVNGKFVKHYEYFTTYCINARR